MDGHLKISFVIPAYNEETIIGGCISSVLRELHGNPCDAEIIVVNNASTDHTAEIARAYPGVIVVNEPAKGIVLARRAGFGRATGDLIANIDADTMLTPGWVTRVLNEFERDPDLVCLSGPFVYHDLSVWARTLQKGFYGLAYVIYLLNRFVFNVNSMVQGGNFIFRKVAFERAGGFNTTIDFYGEDTDVARRLHRVGKVRFTFALPIYASGRRLAQEGVLLTGFRYAINYFWVSFSGKPLTKSSTDVRITKATGSTS
jgi:cellulose synthase/poly-beta-1,6-N-acetylglucosamine synthase-like glycosyltransferase